MPTETNLALSGDDRFYFDIDSAGIVRTNSTISLDGYDPKPTSKLFNVYYLGPSEYLYIDIVVYRPKYEMNINENSNGTVVCKTLSSDYSAILQKSDFVALQSDGLVVVQKPFDYEAETLVNKEYTFDLFSQYSGRNFTTRVTLNIIDENDEAPSFPSINMTYNFKAIQSDLKTVIGVVSAADPDTVGKLNYSIKGFTGDPRFSVSQSGIVTMESAQKSGDAIVTVSDGKSHDTASVHVEVIPVVNNDTHVQINSTCFVYENEAIGTHICNVTETGYTDYIFDSADAQNLFNLDKNTGVISTNAGLDRETKSSYKYSILAKDEKLSCKFASIQVQILIKDKNDNSPNFRPAAYKGSVSENADVGTKVKLEQPISVEDEDEDPTFTYNITGGNFRINSTSGEIYTASKLDRETTNKFSLTVGVFDEIHAVSTSVEIEVEDENDNSPILPNVTFFSVPENASEDAEIGQLHATDADIGENAKLSYTVDSDYFRVTPTGMLIRDRELDRETQDLHVFNCTVSDNGRQQRSVTSRVEVTVTDINDPPEVNNSGELFNVPENSNCTVVPNMTYFFTDNDLGNNRELNFTVQSATGIFFIDLNGVLSCPVLDYEKSEKYYEVKIEATDNGNPAYSATVSIFIAVEDVNDNAPEPSDEREFELTFYGGECKGANCSKLVALITASDVDSGDNGELIYQAIGGNASEFLSVDKDTGLVTSFTPPLPQNGTYHYIVDISDKGEPSLNSTITISLIVAVYEDTSLQIIDIFPTETLRFNWTENVEIPSPFIYLMNFTTNSMLSGIDFHTPNYILADFYIAGSKNDYLYVNTTTLQRKQGHSETSFDREKQNQYRFIVQAKLPQYSRLAELIIDILDVNDNPPQFIDKAHRVAIIKENAKNGTKLNLKFAAVDPDDGENAKIAYKIPREDCGGLFQFTSDGRIFLNGQLDHEKMKSCNLTFTVYNINDEVTMQSSVNVSIEIEDVNDNTPLFNNSVYRVLLNESWNEGAQKTQIGEVLVRVPGFSVDDEDSREYGMEGIRLSIQESCPLLVNKDKAENFILMVNQSMTLDYETKKDYNCTLEAKDGGGLSSTSLLSIELLDINDNSPEADDIIRREVRRSRNISHVIVDVINATDKDSGVNALLNFAFKSGIGNNDYFKINSTNGQISIAKDLSGLQEDRIVLDVIVSDSGQPVLTTTVKVEVNITDDNVRPYFNQTEYNIEVEENTQLSGLLVAVTALDKKKNEEMICNCTYRLMHDKYSDPYIMLDGLGDIYVNRSQAPEYDREAEPTVNLTVIAEDEGGKEAQASVIITVLDKNDNDPKFLKTVYEFEIFQEARVPTIIGRVQAEDRDEGENAVTRYQITNITGNFNESVIAINETTGELFSNGSLDIGSITDFTEYVTVEAIDVKDPGRTDRVQVNVLVRYNDTNQNPPKFNVENSVIPRRISMAAYSEGFQIAVLNVTDADSGKDGQVSYSILDGNAFNMFQIDNTGAISLKRKVEFIGEHDINLTVQAVDKGVNPKASTITLAWKLQGQASCTDPQSATGGPSDTEKLFQTVTWALIGVCCFLILTTAISICGWCRSRLKAKNARSEYGSNRESWGLKYNTSYGACLPLGRDEWKPPDMQDRRNERPGTSFDIGGRYPPNQPEEFDQRKSFRLSLFDSQPLEPPPLPKPRDPGAPFIPKPDYD
ncbi:protocadherin Fat 4-like isoform X2 [Ostrea edulis]|uniref:protocadherin Fat 4-like isoform X2 n=1 Tax=Ostrea edulis TaxID=37623 RepID=UPI0024AF30DD|nr:protocadherin Fat 4-like isoform X2 [Ostrea edulis]